MKKLAFLLYIAALTFTLSSCNNDDDVKPTETAKYQAFNDDMRELWSDHVVWTRNVIINVMDGAPGTTEAVNRLLQNQEDIGDAIKPYYGESAGDSLTDLLVEHINLAATILTAAKAGDSNTFNTAKTAWYVNADDIAEFLNIANPQHFLLSEMKSMMKQHLDQTLEEDTARLQRDYDADVIAFDKVYDHILMMADYLSEGIAEQFPNKF